MGGRTHSIPSRFGLRTILLSVSLFAVLFALTKALDASLRIAAPTMSFVLLVGLGQLLFDKIPRRACASLGALLFPICAWIDPLFDGLKRLQSISAIDLLWLVVCGGIVGYLGGILLAAMFMIAERVRTL